MSLHNFVEGSFTEAQSAACFPKGDRMMLTMIEGLNCVWQGFSAANVAFLKIERLSSRSVRFTSLGMYLLYSTTREECCCLLVMSSNWLCQKKIADFGRGYFSESSSSMRAGLGSQRTHVGWEKKKEKLFQYRDCTVVRVQSKSIIKNHY
jgi:hypothetical protein